MQPSYLVHPRLRQSRMVPERLTSALRDAGRGRVMAPGVRAFGSVDIGVPGGQVTTYDPGADQPGAMVFVDLNLVQCGLNAHGASLTVDGRWGPRTAGALASFVSLIVTPTPTEGAAAAGTLQPLYTFIAPSAGGTSVKMTPGLHDALLAHTDVGPCIAAVVPGANVTPHQPVPGTTDLITSPPASGVPMWVYGVAALAVVGTGVWFFTRKKKGR